MIGFPKKSFEKCFQNQIPIESIFRQINFHDKNVDFTKKKIPFIERLSQSVEKHYKTR